MNMHSGIHVSGHDFGIPCTASTPIKDLRKLMQEKIWEYLMVRNPPFKYVDNEKMMESVVKRVEDGLFKTAPSKEEYLNLETLERRLRMLVICVMNQQLARANSSIGTMVPTPGFQQTGNSSTSGIHVSGQMQNHGIPCTASTPIMDLRKLMQEKIWEYLMARNPPFKYVDNEKKMKDLVKHLEESLFKTATSKEEYLNLETLERRLRMLVICVMNQQLARANSSIGTMVPTPGFQQTGNSSTSSMNMHTDHSGIHVSGQMQNHGIPCTASTPIMDLRKLMQEKIWEYLMARNPPSNYVDNEKMMKDLVKRLEDGLFKTATSKEEYLNLETLGRRLHMLVKCPMNQQLARANSSVGTVVPTPGFQQTGNSSSKSDGSLIILSCIDSVGLSFHDLKLE